ncbi:hypothetical protein pdam_00008322, partial [Pocillopora damicornis]
MDTTSKTYLCRHRFCGAITSPIVKHIKGYGATVVFSSIPDNSKRGFVLSYRGRKCHNPLKWISERY